MLDPAIGKSNGVGAKDIAGSISCLSSVEGSLGVVILDSILVSVRLISVLRSRGVGRLAVGSGIGRLPGVHNIRNIAAVSVRHLVIDRLQTTVRQNDGIRAGGGVAVPLFAGVDLHAVVVVHAVVVGVDGGLVVGRGVGRGGGGVGRGVAVAGCVISDGQSGDGGKNNEDLKSNSDKVVLFFSMENVNLEKLVQFWLLRN